MEEFYMEADWPEKIARQEEILRYTTFTRKQALELGLCIAKLAEEKYKKGAAIRIIEDNTVIFEYKMETTNPENDWWMGKKLAVSLQTGTSSLRAYVEGKFDEPDRKGKLAWLCLHVPLSDRLFSKVFSK